MIDIKKGNMSVMPGYFWSHIGDIIISILGTILCFIAIVLVSLSNGAFPSSKGGKNKKNDETKR
jgi:hypothetical protein